MATPVFTATVHHGLLAHDQPRSYARHVAAFEGKRVEVIVRLQGSKRSDPANRRYRALLRVAAHACWPLASSFDLAAPERFAGLLNAGFAQGDP